MCTAKLGMRVRPRQKTIGHLKKVAIFKGLIYKMNFENYIKSLQMEEIESDNEEALRELLGKFLL